MEKEVPNQVQDFKDMTVKLEYTCTLAMVGIREEKKKKSMCLPKLFGLAPIRIKTEIKGLSQAGWKHNQMNIDTVRLPTEATILITILIHNNPHELECFQLEAHPSSLGFQKIFRDIIHKKNLDISHKKKNSVLFERTQKGRDSTYHILLKDLFG